MSAVVLITGAAGGLGQALVGEFAGQKWRIAAGHYRTSVQVKSDAIWPVALDVTNAERVDMAVEEILQRWGRIDLLINNAGLARDKLCAQMTGEHWQDVLNVNLKGAFLCSRAVLRPMLKQRSGHIINISSFSARAGAAGQANYAAAKAGAVGLTQSLAREVGSRNIRVNAILPGVLPTGMTAELGDSALAEFAAANALRRINSVEEVARFVRFLAGMQNVSGQVFQLDSRITRWT